MPEFMVQDGEGYSRILPRMEPQNFTTYGVVAPRREVPCEQDPDGCGEREHGWFTKVDISTGLGRRQYDYIKHRSGRRFEEVRESDTIVQFNFYAGQRCFGTHTVPDADERFGKRGGDWRGNPRGDVTMFSRADDWIDSFWNHQDRLITAIRQG